MTTVSKAGRYEIVGELGRGAMGVVYRAIDPVIGRTVAVKTIKLSEQGTGLTRPELLSRFQTEARAAGLLTHPNIVVVFDAGEESGLYYITMELVEGKSLQALIDEGQIFSLPRVLRIMEQTCGALQFAHERNVVHRDIKPANLMLTADDTVKVTDFGTAKILQFGTVHQTAHVMGTPSYMSPEQVKGRAVDGRSDIFSLGVLMYEIVTGEKPFPGQNITTVIYKIVNEEPVPPRQIDASIHAGMSAVIMKALTKDPDQRYQTCREMLEDLRNYRALASGGNAQATMIGGAGGPMATVAAGQWARVDGSGADGAQAGLRGMRGGANPGAGSSGLVNPNDSATARSMASLAARAGSPGQTPVLRKTGAIAPLQAEPKKKNWAVTLLSAMFLLAATGYGMYRLWPTFEDVLKLRAAQKESAVQPSDTERKAGEAPSGSVAEPAKVEAKLPVATEARPEVQAATGATTLNTTPNSTTPTVAVTAPATTAVPEPVVLAGQQPEAHGAIGQTAGQMTAQAAAYKLLVDRAIQERGLRGQARVNGDGSSLTLSGKLRVSDHAALLKFLKSTPPPAGITVVDHVEYNDTPVASEPAEVGAHPVAAPGRGAIHVVTDVVGATAVLRGPGGRVIRQCLTPCSFNDLLFPRYSLDVTKTGYQPVQTAVQVTAGKVLDQKIKLESQAEGVLVKSEPAGADVFINGAKQGGQTPVDLPLAPGQYNIVLRLQGHEGYAGRIQVKDNVQTLLDVPLAAKSLAHVAWAQVETTPKGAEILVDGVSSGQQTPARVQVAGGMHSIVMRLQGYQDLKRVVQASDGGTVTVQESLKKKQ